VVFPIAATAEKDGTFVDWEGRERQFVAALNSVGIPPDGRVLTAIADEMDVLLRLGDPAAARVELHRLGVWTGVRAAEPMVGAAAPAMVGSGEAVLATWRLLLDSGRAQDGEEHLAGTARAPRVRLGKSLATELGVAEGDPVTVSTDRGRITLPLEITEMPDRVVWLPMNSPGSAVLRELGTGSGAVVRVSAGGAE
jgi:NADH-quinone oxidoreductase subunit G